ncbi:MAG: hypothetical protein AAFN30_19855 [Actinomycetota bacterium]
MRVSTSTAIPLGGGMDGDAAAAGAATRLPGVAEVFPSERRIRYTLS